MTKYYNVLFSQGLKSHILRYEIIDSPVSQIWANQVKILKSYSDCHVYRNQWIKAIASKDNIDSLWRKMSENVALYNSLEGTNIVMADRPNWNESDQEVLNFLHLEFHKFSDSLTEDSESAEIMDRLNMDIHNVETMLTELAYGIKAQGAGFFLHSKKLQAEQAINGGATVPAPILDRGLYECWNYDEQWGDLLLGYHTIGKNLNNCWKDNDQEVVKTGMVRPQVTISNEVVMDFKDFNTVSVASELSREMIDWVYANSLENYIDPNLPENAIVGRPLLGKLVKSYTPGDIEEIFRLGAITDSWLS